MGYCTIYRVLTAHYNRDSRLVCRKYPINSTVQSTLKSTVQSTV